MLTKCQEFQDKVYTSFKFQVLFSILALFCHILCVIHFLLDFFSFLYIPKRNIYVIPSSVAAIEKTVCQRKSNTKEAISLNDAEKPASFLSFYFTPKLSLVYTEKPIYRIFSLFEYAL